MGKQIASAAPGGMKIEYEDFLGKLFVVEPLAVEKGIKTEYGESDAVRANVFVLLGKGKVEEFEDALIFPRVLQGQTRRKIGEVVVGRLTQGEAKKKGHNPPWVLAEATADDIKKATTFWASRSIGSASDEDDDDEDSF